MNTFVKWFLIICVCFVFQTTLMNLLAVNGVKPDLLIIVLFFLSIKHGFNPGIYAGFFLGLTQDLYLPFVLGQNALAKTITGFFFGMFNEKNIRSSLLMKMSLLFAGFILHDTIVVLSLIIKNSEPISTLFSNLFLHTLPRTAYSLVIMLLIYLWNRFIYTSIKR